MKTFTVSLSRAQALELLAFCKRHNQGRFFFAKDQGAYFCAHNPQHELPGAEPSCVIYMPGCDPRKNPDWYDTARSRFGGDDFGEYFPVSLLQEVESDPKITAFQLRFTATQIKAGYKLAA